MHIKGKDHSAGASSLAASLLVWISSPSPWLPRSGTAIHGVVNRELIHLLGELSAG